MSVKITALYERLSRNDEMQGESNSIKNRKEYLEDFARKNGFQNIRHFPDGTAKKACEFALRRVGYPYSQDLRHSGTHFDCSSLVYYAWLDAGVDISYGGATTAGYEAQGLANVNKTALYGKRTKEFCREFIDKWIGIKVYLIWLAATNTM